MEQQVLQKSVQELVQLVHYCSNQHWTPATSSNFSVRLRYQPSLFVISASGIDKAAFSEHDVLVVDFTGQPIDKKNSHKPSAETLLHTAVYQTLEPGCVAHTHSILATVLSMRHVKDQGIWFEGFEILKGLEGIKSHTEKIWLPIFANSQDIPALAAEVKTYLAEHPKTYGFLIEGHGLYTWGKDSMQTRRHLEVFEFLFQCLFRLT